MLVIFLASFENVIDGLINEAKNEARNSDSPALRLAIHWPDSSNFEGRGSLRKYKRAFGWRHRVTEAYRAGGTPREWGAPDE